MRRVRSRPSEVGICHRPRHYEVDRPFEEDLKIFFETEIRLEGVFCGLRELDEEVDVAPISLETVCQRRTKNLQATDPVRAAERAESDGIDQER